MQVKFSRSKGKVKTGMFGSAEMYQLYAMVAYDREQVDAMNRHNRWERAIWLEVPGVEQDGGGWSRQISHRVLKEGAIVHHTNMNVIFAAEEQIIQGLKNEVASCKALDTFTGNGTGERVVEINGNDHRVVATA